MFASTHGRSVPSRWCGSVCSDDVNQFATLAVAELHGAIDHGEQGVVAALAHVDPRVELRPSLAHDDGSSLDRGAAEGLHAQTLSVRISSVSGGTATLGLRH